jgi:ligand-binding SRPBCC domain-containing protein
VPTIRIDTVIHAPPSRCFDLARSVEVHLESTAATGEIAVGGVTTGLLGLGDQVTWRARHLGVRQHLTSEITGFDAPHHFRDSMVCGAFARFDHDHAFTAVGADTVMRDVFDFDAPLGVLGRIAERLFLTDYLARLLRERGLVIKRVAETEAWRRYLPSGTAEG